MCTKENESLSSCLLSPKKRSDSHCISGGKRIFVCDILMSPLKFFSIYGIHPFFFLGELISLDFRTLLYYNFSYAVTHN